MTRMNSRPVTITQVYPQDTEPTDTRDGILWVDTSVSPPDTKTYDASSASWEPVATSNVKVQDTAPSSPTDGMVWVDTSLSRPRAKVYDAAADQWNKQVDATEFGSHKGDNSAHHSRPSAGTGLSEDSNGNFNFTDHSRPTSTQSASASGGYQSHSPNNSPETTQIDMVSDEVAVNNTNGSSSDVTVNFADGSSTTQTVSGNGTYTFTFAEQEVSSVKVQYSDTDFDVHIVTLAAHSHNI